MPIVNIELIRWKYGGRLDFWAKNAKLAREFVKAQGLNPATTESLAKENSLTRALAQKRNAGTKTMAARKLPNGGWPLPHLHVGDDIFALNAKQWKAFTVKLLKDYEQKLERAGSISFDQGINLSTAMDAISLR